MPGLRVLCAGDQFIGADAFAEQVRAVLGADTEPVRYQTGWPDEAFGPVEGVREASGDVAELARLAEGADVLLTHLAPVTETVLAAAPGLKVIGVTRGGPVNVDLAAATRRGVPVVHLPGRNLGAVAEFTVGVMVTLMRGVNRASRELAEGRWSPRAFHYDTTGPELRASTVGLVGFGAVGSRVAELLRGFGSTVVTYDPYGDPAAIRSAGVEQVGTLGELLAVADVVSLHARLSDETRRMMDADAFAALRPGSYLVNTARGELVDHDALLTALESGRLAGAALDVFDPEPPGPDSPLVGRPDVIPTPHLAGASRQVASESVQRVVAEVARYLADGTLTHCANPQWVEQAGGRG